MKFCKKIWNFFILIMILALLLAMTSIAGCITVSKSADAEPETTDLMPPDAHETLMSNTGTSAATQRETKSTVMAAEPFLPEGGEEPECFLPPDLFMNSSAMLGTLFQEERSIVIANYAYSVDVAAPPLVLWFDVEPWYDDPRESYFSISVRDQSTGELLVKNGYGRVYSGSTEREVTLYRAGTYHINIEARQIDVDFKILTADAPLQEEAVMPSGQPTPNPYEMWEYF